MTVTAHPSPPRAEATGWRPTPAVLGVGGLTAVVVVLVLVRQLSAGLEYDESFNLTVVKNLADGLGYRSNGAVDGGPRVTFDPYVTTGPSVLLPAAVAWWASDGALWAARLVPSAFFLGLLAGLFGLWRDRAGAHAGVGAVALVLAFDVVPDLTRAGLSPARVVGEVAATALLVCAAWALVRRHPGLAGLLAGLAVQAKSVMVFGAAILLAIVLVEGYRRQDRWSAGEIARCIGGCVVPTLAFEAYRLLTLGPEGYVENLVQLRDYSRLQVGAPSPTQHLVRLLLLSTPVAVVCLTLLGLVTAASLILHGAARSGPALHRSTREERAGSAVRGLLAGAVVSGASWVFLSTQPSPRQALPALILLVSAGGALLLPRAGTLVARGGSALAAGAMIQLLVGLTVLGSGLSALLDHSTDQQLTHQTEAARVLEQSGTPAIPTDGWDQNPEYQVLTDLPTANLVPTAPPTVDVFTWISDPSTLDARVAAVDCANPLVWTYEVVICRRSGQH